MGCITSKKDINDVHPNIFEATNVDDGGRHMSPGQLEVTETELVFYQRGKGPTRWPLRCLRKYGFDIEAFSFECGRRCPTGHGIYAFRCLKAEQLFNLVQHNIQLKNLSDDNFLHNDFPIPLATTGPPVHRRTSASQVDNYLNPSNNQTVRPHPTLSRPGSITSNGPLSPPALSPLSLTESHFEQNNNKRNSLVMEHSYTNTNALLDPSSPSYINIAMSNIVPTENYVNIQETNNRLYMNVNCDSIAKESLSVQNEDLDVGPSYANIEASEMENLKPLPRNVELESVPDTPTSLYVTVKEVNYAELELIPGKSGVSQQAPDSPAKIKKSYVTIDFNKTNALSHSINPKMDIEEGSRKTRHNSTIGDMPTRHSSSLSD